MPRASRSVIRAILRGGLLLPLMAASSPAAAASFTHRTVVTVDRNQVPGVAGLTDFPVLVSVTSANLRTTANGGFVTSSQAHDVIFQGEDAPTCSPAAAPCRLDHEIESYDGVNGTILAWVRVPAVRGSLAGSNTPIFMYYGDAGIACAQENKTGVWDASYREVFHLHEAGDHTDSSANAFTAVGKGAVTMGVAGKVGPGVDFGGGVLGTTPARLIVSDGKVTTTDSFTFEAWVYFRSYVPGGYVGFVTKGRECLNFDGSPVPQPGYCLAEPCGDWISLYKANADTFSLGWAWGGGPGGCKVGNMDDPGPVVNTSQWYHVAGSFDLATQTRRLFVDGTQVVSDSGAACLSADIPHYTLMGVDNLQDDYLDGVLDEMRVSFTARSGAWIQSGYNNQNAPFVGAGGFYASVAHQTGSWTVGDTACPAQDPCAGGPGTCSLRSIGNTAAYTTGSGTCTATNGSPVVSCPGAGWQSANRGRGDRITIDGTDYMVRAVDSETQLQLASPFAGTTGVGTKAYVMSRQFATLQAWSTCITGGGGCPYFPVASGDLVTGTRSEVGVVYTEGSPYTAAGVSLVDLSGSTTDASHTITLTADGSNRHYGVSGAGVILDNQANGTRAVLLQTAYPTAEWLEIRNGGTSGAHCIDYVTASPANRAVIRNNILRNCSAQSIRIAGSGPQFADIYNNIVYRGTRDGFHIQNPLGAGSRVRVFNNTFLRNGSAAGTPWTEVSTAETPNPYVTLRNNIIVDDAQSPDVTWNGSALCTNAANCDWWNVASGDNITGDAAPPSGKWKSDIGPNPRGTGFYGQAESALSFVDTTAGTENLHIQAGSVAFNAGSDLTIPVNGDIDAQIRTAPWDIGADELPASAAAPLMAYSNNAASGVRPLDYTTYQAGVWSAPGQVAVPGPFPTPSDWPLTNKVGRMSADGLRSGVVFVEADLGNRNPLHATFWDGTAWTDGAGSPGSTYLGQSGDVSNITTRHFDAAFEQVSGEFVVVTGINTDESVNIYVNDGAAWSGNLRFTPAGNGVMADQAEVSPILFRWVRLAPRPGTNQIAFVGMGDDGTGTSGTVHGAIWNGDTNTFFAKTVLSFPVSNGQNANSGEAIDIEYVLGGANAGEAIAVWGNGTQVYSARWSQAGSWSSSTSIANLGGANTARWIRLATKPQGDRMVVAVGDSNQQVRTVAYDATTRTWGSLSAFHTTTAYGNALYNRPFDLAFDPSSGAGDVRHVYSDTTGIRFRVSTNDGVVWGPQQTLTAGSQAFWVQMVRDPSSVLHLAIADQADDLRAWSGTAGSFAVTTPSLPSVNLERNANHSFEPFTLATYPPQGSVTTAVGLMSFSATGADAAVDLAWQTGSELDNLGFHLYRGPEADGPWTRLTSALIPGLGSSPLGQGYSWRDPGLVNGQRYYYRLEDVDTASVSTFHGPVSAVPQGPAPGAGEEGGGEGEPPPPAPGPGTPPPDDGSPGPSEPPPGPGETPPTPESPPVCSDDGRCLYGDPGEPSLRVLSRTAQEMTVELVTPGFVATPAPPGVELGVTGFADAARVGFVDLPFKRALLDAVVGRRARLVAVAAADELSWAELRPAVVGRPAIDSRDDGTVRAVRQRLPLGSSVPLSVPRAHLAGEAFMGQAKKLALELHPLRWDPAQGRLVLSRTLRVRIAFAGAVPREGGDGSLGRRNPRSRRTAPLVLAHLHTTGRGLHAVAYEDLFPSPRRPVPLAALRLVQDGRVVPVHVEPPGDTFGPGGHLYFHADRTASSTDYSEEISWALERTAGGQEMALASAAPRTDPVGAAPVGQVRAEVDRIYQPGLLDAPDVWLWDFAQGGALKTVSVDLHGVDPTAAVPARVRVFLQGASDAGQGGEHHLSFSWNGLPLGETTFEGMLPHVFEGALAASSLLEGTNTLTFVNVGDTGVISRVFLDRLEIDYPETSALRGGRFSGEWTEEGVAEVTLSDSGGSTLALDVTDPGSPVWLSGLQPGAGSVLLQVSPGRRHAIVAPEGLLVPRVSHPVETGLRDTGNQADYVLVAPRAFMDAAQPLLLRRESQGLATYAASLEDIAQDFGGGAPSAEAIRDFLAFAFHSWQQPSPRYVVLLGDASFDPRNFTGFDQGAPLPALWAKTSYLWTASDPALAAVNGEDLLPDLALGRLPATNLAQAHALVEKVLDWEDAGYDLSAQATLVADNPDEAGDFEADIADIRQSFLASRNPQSLLVRTLGASTRPAILEAMNGGLSLLSYVGHGGSAVWASENVLNSFDPPALLAQPQQPFMLTMNCLNGYFVQPNLDSLAEAFLKAEGRGTIAAFSPSGLSLDAPAHVFHRALVNEIINGSHERLGDAVLAAQQAYALSGHMPELLGVYNLLGDPAMKILR